jgi:hypothetical protein
MISLASSTIQAMKNEIDDAKLSATYRDAIEVARRLQIRFQWIDSLCIIQDSRADWEEEAVKMVDVYRYSFCTLAAVGAAECDGGLFMQRNENLVQPEAFAIDRPWFNARYIAIDPSSWLEDYHISELNSRGWIFQERFLSPRTLYFGIHQLVWECAKSMQFERYFSEDILPSFETARGVPHEEEDINKFGALDPLANENLPVYYTQIYAVITIYLLTKDLEEARRGILFHILNPIRR